MKRLLVITVASLSAVVLPGIVFASDYGLKATAKAADLDKVGSTDLPTLIGNVIGTALSLVAVIFFALMIYGGIRWMLSRGNEDQSKKALDTIVAAIIGMIIVLASYAITTFVFNTIGQGQSASTQTNVSSAGSSDASNNSNPLNTVSDDQFDAQDSEGAVGDWCLGSTGCYQLTAQDLSCAGQLYKGADAEAECLLDTPTSDDFDA